MTGILDQPVRVDREGERLYFFNGRVSVDMNGSEAERKLVLEFLAQAQEMAMALLEKCETHDERPESLCQCSGCKVLRDSGVLP